MAFLSNEVLQSMGFKYLGKDVKISDKASVYNPGEISIGDHSRIDDFCILSAGQGGIVIKRFVHIACYSSLIGKEQILFEDFSCVSSRVSVYSSSDDFSGSFLTNPTVSENFTNVHSAPVIFRKHALMGSNGVVLPGVTLGIGSAVGAFSLVLTDIEPFCIYAGAPARKLKDRKNNLLNLEEKFLSTINNIAGEIT